MSISFWRRWLLVVTGGVIVYGLSLMLFPDAVHTLFNALFFASSEVIQRFGDDGRDFITLVYGVLGAVVAAWMVMLWSILTGLFPQNPRAAWNTITVSLVVWFVLDSGFSLLVGAVSHALFNTLFLALFALPLGFIYRHLRQHEV